MIFQSKTETGSLPEQLAVEVASIILNAKIVVESIYYLNGVKSHIAYIHSQVGTLTIPHLPDMLPDASCSRTSLTITSVNVIST